ncbi:hypothetical protein B0H13DRAFT_1850636 [Mycena leptocephala]|nr:hypothetical protein B0H13DRAFT_1850636 [Mycena leptocephala]
MRGTAHNVQERERKVGLPPVTVTATAVESTGIRRAWAVLRRPVEKEFLTVLRVLTGDVTLNSGLEVMPQIPNFTPEKCSQTLERPHTRAAIVQLEVGRSREAMHGDHGTRSMGAVEPSRRWHGKWNAIESALALVLPFLQDIYLLHPRLFFLVILLKLWGALEQKQPVSATCKSLALRRSTSPVAPTVGGASKKPTKKPKYKGWVELSESEEEDEDEDEGS